MRLPFVSVVAASVASVRPMMNAAALRPTMSAAIRPAISPPVARRVPHTVSFGRVAGENRGTSPMEPAIELNDDFFWIRDDTRKNEKVLGLLREENAYTQARTAHLDRHREACDVGRDEAEDRRRKRNLDACLGSCLHNTSSLVAQKGKGQQVIGQQGESISAVN